jgi:hypothetical protein
MNTILNEDRDNKKMDVAPDCSPEVLEETVNFMYGKDIKKSFNDFAGLLDAAERFMMEDFKSEIGNLMVIKVDLNENNYMEICSLANKYKVEAVADMCANYIHFKATSTSVDWEALKRLPVIAASSMALFKTKLDSMKGYNNCTIGHNCNCAGRADHVCSAVITSVQQHVCSVHSSNHCTYRGSGCTSCCTYTGVMASE